MAETHEDATQPPMDDPTQPFAVTPPEPVTTLPPGPGRGTPGTPGAGTIVATALLSAVLASGGTVAVLSSTGALHPAGAPASAPASSLDGAQTVRIDESSAVVDAAAKVSPAVVRITASGVTTDQLGGTIPAQGVGSGVIFDAAGWILTNRHVVQIDSNTIASKLTVELKDGHQYTGTVYGTDTLTDLAIVKIDATGLTAAPIGTSADIKVGELAIAIGSPLGTYSNSVTSGIVSGTGRSVVVETGRQLTNLIQTDAAINPGNSGGPLLDAAGNVIGINTAIAQNSSGIGFAIPIDIARPVMRQALAGQPLARPYMGVRYEAIDVQVKAEEHLSVDQGALIISSPDATGATQPAIVPGGPAEKAGLKAGDIIVAVESQAIDAEHPLDLVLSGYAPGQTIDLTILRSGVTSHVKITLGTRPES
ncbi:MAG: trypsin-like peptidase domain-containing protein [Chloroflexi bacterium]|nr:trypsin-like peptidase domain-containing protein [Chloroflexota bacterium]